MVAPEECVVANLFDKNLVTAIDEKLVLYGESGALASPGGAGDKFPSANSGFHAPVVVGGDVTETPPDTRMIGFMVLVVTGLGRVISTDLNAVRGANLFEVGAGGIGIVPDVGGDRLIVERDIQGSFPGMEGELGFEALANQA